MPILVRYFPLSLCLHFSTRVLEYSHGDEHEQYEYEPRADEHQAGDFKHFALLFTSDLLPTVAIVCDMQDFFTPS